MAGNVISIERGGWRNLRIDVGIMSILLNKLTARRHIITHKHGERPLSLSRIINCNLTKQPLVRIHRSGSKLLSTHLTKTFVTLHIYALLRTLSKPESSLLALSLSPAIDFLLAFLPKLKRRRGKIYISVLDKVYHISEEESKD